MMNLYFRITHPFYKKMIAMADRYVIRAGCYYQWLHVLQRDNIGEWQSQASRQKYPLRRKKYVEENTPDTTNLNGLYFDGTKDNTLQINGTKKIEELVTIINEPGS